MAAQALKTQMAEGGGRRGEGGTGGPGGLVKTLQACRAGQACSLLCPILFWISRDLYIRELIRNRKKTKDYT